MPESDAELEFIALHFGKKLKMVNPRGRVGIITLWSRPDFVTEKLAEAGVDLSQNTSKIAVIGTLYGNGIPHLLRNLLYNPQVRDLVICGADRSGSAGELVAFFEKGLEETESLGATVHRIAGTNRIMDALVRPEMFAVRPAIARFGELKSKQSARELADHLRSLTPQPVLSAERIEVELPEVEVCHYPSDPRNHSIAKDSPLEAWRELVFRLVRFGHSVQLRKGDRQELQNMRVVIRRPQPDDAAELEKYGVTLESLREYQHDMLVGPLPEDQPYTYGNRIREYYGFDALDKFAERLRRNPQDRDCYLALWDSHKDIDAEDAPCLVSMFFRVFEDELTFTAIYRTHNALDAWLKNVYGLMETQRIVADKAGLKVGPMTVISHSISIDPSRYDVAKRIADAKGFSLEFDPNGQFLITVDREAGEIVVQHTTEDGQTLHEYRSPKAERIQYELNRDCAISDINHAIYIGRMLAKAEMCLGTGEEFVES